MKNIRRGLLVLLFLFSQIASAGEFGNHCTFSLSEQRLFKTQCLISAEFEGKTYCFGTEAGKDSFLEDPKTIISKAQAFYDKQTMAEANGKDLEGRTKISQAEALAQINSQQCDLSNRDAGYLEFDGLNLSHCKMVNTSFFGAYLRGANLSGANLEGADINRSNFSFANLRNANLRNTDLFRADFSQADLTGADITGSNLKEAVLDGTIMTGVKGLEFIAGYKTEKGMCVDCNY